MTPRRGSRRHDLEGAVPPKRRALLQVVAYHDRQNIAFWPGDEVDQDAHTAVGPRVAEIAEMWGRSAGSNASQPHGLITEETMTGSTC